MVLGDYMKKTLFLLITFFLFVSCSNKQKTNIFEDFYILMEKDNVIKVLEDKQVNYQNPTKEEQIKKNESRVESIEKKALENMPEDYITYKDTFFSINNVSIFLYFCENSLYKIEVNSYPISENKEERISETKKNLNIFNQTISKYFVNSEYKQYDDFFGNKHYYYSLEEPLGKYIDIESSNFGIELQYIEPLLNMKIKRQKEEYAEKIRRNNPEYTGKWYVLKDYYVALKNIEGQFSNSVTTNSKLKVNLKYTKDNKFEIELYEYGGKNPVKGSYSSPKKYTIFISNNNEKSIGLYGYNYYNAIIFSNEDSEKIYNLLTNNQENIKFHILGNDYSTSDYIFTIKDSYGLDIAVNQLKN